MLVFGHLNGKFGDPEDGTRAQRIFFTGNKSYHLIRA